MAIRHMKCEQVQTSSIRLSLLEILEPTAIILNGDTGFRPMIMSKGFGQYEWQVAGIHNHAIILIRLSRERSFTMPTVTRT